ncbi:PH domain-containing protein [Clostridium tarantellae]|uniref:PH domain-containing protein n=1 Tax=Clostridium tarantellae TaxID=39493 RepID=A0A6I1MK28_9CLOT|nr:PH domain-containing protein [Clostridium tarantellae]MPQ43073.1 PH domain-containing protein [Clostridium tarantellae]
MEYSKLNHNAKKSWFISRIISTLIIGSILIGLDYFIIKVLHTQWGKNNAIFIHIIIGTIILLLLLNTFLYPFIEYKQWRYLIDNDKVDFSEGIFSIRRTIIPIIRIQHINLNQGPINRIFKLVDIEIVTAGGTHRIPNIELEKAEKISEYLKDKVKEKVEVNV